MPPQQRPGLLSEAIPVLVTSQIPGLNGASVALQAEFNKLPLNSLIKDKTTGDWYLRGGVGLYGASTDNRMVKIPTTGGSTPSDFVVVDTNNAGITDVVTMTHEVTNTAVAGIGTGEAFYVQNGAGNNVFAGEIAVRLTDVTNAAESAEMALSLFSDDAGGTYALREAALLSYGGGETTFRPGIGHNGPTPGNVNYFAPAAAGTDIPGATVTRGAGLGTGNGVPGTLIDQVGVPVGAGTAAQVFIPALSHNPVGTSPNAGVRADFGGGLRLNRIANTAAAAITVREYNCIIGITAAPAASRTVALPTPGTTAGTAKAGAVIIIQDEFGGLTSTNTLVISSAGSTIDGAATLVMGVARSAVTLVSTGDATLGWKIASFFSPTTHAVSTAGGNVTLDARTGRFRINNGQTAVTITNATVQGATSTILLSRYAGFDATLLYVTAVASAGSFLVTGNAAATTANTDWQFEVINPIA